MCKFKASKTWLPAVLMAVVLAGCSDSDKGSGKPGDPLTPPTVISVTPPDVSIPVCPESAVISATFSKAINPATISAASFTLTSSTGVSLPGQVSYVVGTHTAIFVPSSGLAPSSTYTATITNKVADVYGITLVASKVWTFATSPSCEPPPPSVTSVTPLDASVLICPNNSPLITATFSKAMDPLTLNAASFTLTSSGASVPGQVIYVSASKTATFTPTNGLAPSTIFLATVTKRAADTLGGTLAADKVWTFTTPATCQPPPPPTNSGLGAACSFGILAGSTVTNVVGTATTVGGDVGVWPLSAITGFDPPAKITGATHAADAVAQAAQGDLTVAYNNAAGAAGGAVLPADIGGQTLPPGVYKTTSAQPSLGITGNLTLDGKGDPNAVFIFQIVSTLTTATENSKVILIGSAQAKNVYWQVGSSATLGTNTMFTGTIMAQAAVTLTSGATLNGRALARTAAVTLDTSTVVVPPCP